MQNRTKHAIVTLIVGLALNIVLGASKFAVGVIYNSTSVTSDALNNISDAVISLVTICAIALSTRRADHNHPYGHGRYEYIASFVVGAAILAVGIEVFSSGLHRVIEPVHAEFGIPLLTALSVSIGVKAFMAIFYFVRFNLAKSDTLKAACLDSISDVAVTTVVLCCLFAEKYTGAHIDGYASMAVAVVIVVCAIKILKRTISRLLGERPDPQLYDTLRDIISAENSVISVHDIIINDYGEAKKIAEADAVFPSDMTFLDVHAACDNIEREAYAKTGVRLSVHADPFVTNDNRLDRIRVRLKEILSAFGVTAHDISINDEIEQVELDIKIGEETPESELVEQVKARIRSIVPYAVVVNVDYI